MGSILWVLFLKGFNSLSHMEKRYNSLSHTEKKFGSWRSNFFQKKRKRLKSSSHVKKVQFFESYEKVQKCWILRVNHIFQRGSILRVTPAPRKEKGFDSLSHIFQKRFNSVTHISKKDIQFFESYWQKFKSVAYWKKSIQFCESYWKRFIKRGSTLWVIFEKGFYSLRNTLKGSIHWFIFCVFEKKNSSSLWVQKGKIYSLSHIFFLSHTKNGSILWIILKKKFNSVSHIKKKGAILWVILKKRVRFFETYFPKRIN